MHTGIRTHRCVQRPRGLSEFCTQAPVDSGPGLSGTAEIATGDKHIALALECSATDPRSSVPFLPACPPLWPINYFLTLDVGWEIRPPQVSKFPLIPASSLLHMNCGASFVVAVGSDAHRAQEHKLEAGCCSSGATSLGFLFV